MSQCGNWRSKPIGRAPCGSICPFGKQIKMGILHTTHHSQKLLHLPRIHQQLLPFGHRSEPMPHTATASSSWEESVLLLLSCQDSLFLHCLCFTVCMLLYIVAGLFVYVASSSPLPSRKWPFLLWCEAWDCSCPFETWPSHLLKM